MSPEAALRAAVRLAADELAEAILPAVLARLRQQTERLQHLAERLTRDPGRGLDDAKELEELEADQDLGGRIGWCLGVLAAAAGTDLLLARRERDGLARMAALLALARPEHRAIPSLEELPDLSPGEGAGWEVPLLVTYAFLVASRGLPAGAELRWSARRRAETVVISIERPADAPAPGARLGELLPLVPGARLAPDAGRLALSLPARWLAADR